MEFTLAGLPESAHRMFFRGTDIGRSVEESQHTPGLMTGSQGSRPILLEERRTSEQSEIKILWGRVPNFIKRMDGFKTEGEDADERASGSGGLAKAIERKRESQKVKSRAAPHTGVWLHSEEEGHCDRVHDRVSQLHHGLDPHPLAEIKQPLGYSHATQTNPQDLSRLCCRPGGRARHLHGLHAGQLQVTQLPYYVPAASSSNLPSTLSNQVSPQVDPLV